jgi:hypothetical protein
MRFPVLWWMLLVGICCFFSSDEDLWSVEALHANFNDRERRHYVRFLMTFFFALSYIYTSQPHRRIYLTFSSYRIMNMNILTNLRL